MAGITPITGIGAGGSGGGGGGGVTSVGATSPVASSGGATPTISMPAATGSNAGYMTAAQAAKVALLSGTNTGDQTSIVGITGTKAQFDTAVTDGNFLYNGDVTQYTDEMAQDAIGAMIDGTLTYVDGTPLLSRSALTGEATASAGSNSITLSNAAVIAKVLTGYVSGAGTVSATDTILQAIQKLNGNDAATLAAAQSYADGLVTGLLDLKNGVNASANPNYPSALKGDAYYVTVAGKIGGASGISVDVGDVYVASADNAGGTQAAVGSSWFILEHNLVGALVASNNLSDLTNAATARTNLGLGTLATQSGTFSGTSSGTNTGDQTSIVGITGTKTQFNTAVTDGDILYVGDVTQYTDEMAQDAIGVMVDSSLVYVDATPLLTRAALTGEATASQGSNAVTLTNSAVIGKTLTGFSSSQGNVSATDTILQAFNKIVGTCDLQNTGLISGGVVTINADPTKFNVSAGTGVVIDYSTPTAPVKTFVSWNAFTAQTIPDFTKPFTTVEIDSAGSLVKVSSFASDGTPSVRRVKIVLALLQHFGGTQIENVLNIVQLGYNATAGHHDYIYELGPINKGNNASANGANLQINKASGTTTLPYINYFNDANTPSTRTNSSASAVTFNYNYRNGSGGFVITSDTNTITPNLYDDGTGVLATVANNKFTVQRIYYFAQSDKYGVVYGQAQYASIAEAQAAIFTENPTINPLADSGTFVTALIVKKGATALNNTADANFTMVSSSTNTPTATASLQSAYNNSTSTEITTDSTRGALTLKRGSAADSDNVLEVTNGAGTVTNVIEGNGWHGIGTATPTGSLEVAATVFNPGTVAVSGTAITGTGTSFTRTFKVGDSITTTTGSGSETKEIQTLTSDTAMTTVSAFTGTNSGATYTNSNSGSQLVVLPNGGIRGMGTTGVSANNTSDWIYTAPSVTTTGTQSFSSFRDRTTYNQATTTSGTLNAIAAGPNLNATGSGSFGAVRGFNAFPTVLGTNTGNISTLSGLLSAPTINVSATGTITNINGLSIQGTNSSTTNTVTNWYGINIAPVQAGGTLTNYAGIAIAAKPTAATNSSLLLLGTTTIPSGSYGIYNASTNDNYIGGNVGIGSTPVAARTFEVSKNVTGGTTAQGIRHSGVVQSDVTAEAIGIGSFMGQAAGFTLPDMEHFYVAQGTISGTVTRQYGLYVSSNLVGATNNYGVHLNIPSGTNRYNLYAAGTADNFLAGNTGIGTAAPAGTRLRVGGTSTGAVFSNAIQLDPAIQTDVTSGWRGMMSIPSVTVGATVPQLIHFYANPNTFSGTVTNQMGFYAESSNTGATNNYGFYGNIASGSNRYNLYMAGTADNYLAGSLGIGAVPVAAHTVLVSKNMTGATNSFGIRNNAVVQSDVTSGANGFVSGLGTQAATFTLSALRHFDVDQGTMGLNSTVTSQYGYAVESSMTGGTNNYGFWGNIASGSNRWNLYMNGTALNYMNGALLLGTTTDDTVSKLQVNGKTLFADLMRSTSKSVVSTNSLTTATVSAQRTYFTGTAGASFQVTLPAAASTIDGVFIVVMSTAARASATWVSTGATFVGAPTSLTANVPVKFQYDHATTQWFITA